MSQPASNEMPRPAILFIGENAVFRDFVTAVGIAAGTHVVGLPGCRQASQLIARTHPPTRFEAAIVDMVRPDHDAATILPHLAAARSITHLAILVDHPSPGALAAAERMACTISTWKLEFWFKPVHAGFLKSRLSAMSGTFARDGQL